MSVPLPSLLLAIGSAVLGSAFVATDAALGSLSSARIAALLEQDELPYKHALVRFQREPWGMRSTYLVGRVLCAAVTAVLLTEVVEGIVGGWLGTLLAIVGTVAIYAPISDLATSVARQNPDAWGLRLATLLRPLEVLFFPLAAPLAIMTKALLARFSERETTDPMVATAEVEYLVDEVERSGVVGAEPAEIIRNVLEFEDRRAKDVMVPRARVEAIDLSTPLAEVRRLVANSGHSRYPVFESQLDNVIGLLVAKDVFRAEHAAHDQLPAAGEGHPSPESDRRSLVDIVRKDLIFVPEQQKLVTLLREMKQKRQHLAVVVDEFGGTTGIVTLEDVIEEIIGDIRDEHDEAEAAPIQELADGRLVVTAGLPFADLAAYLGLDEGGEDPERQVGALFGPDVSEGQHAHAWGLELVAKEVKSGRPERIEITRPPRSTRPPDATPSSRRRSGAAPRPEPGDEDVDPAASG
ncbi:MAG: HlyC/CorC family transporter [Polyangiaceae bacterium]|nr:HlyC/CorC family transporter [Polyangiaceae bacterium]